MKSNCIIFSGILLLASLISFSQNIPVEVVLSDKDYRYQHFFFKELAPESRFGFFHTSSMYFFYDEKRKTEMMSQSYLTLDINRSITVLGGTFYANVPGFKASGALQYKYVKDNLFVLVAPRIDLWKDPSYELFTLAEYRPPISKRLSLYTRVQTMSNFSQARHNRSYQNVRLGVGNKYTQAGLALNYDQYGSEVSTVMSMGVFLRHSLGNK